MIARPRFAAFDSAQLVDLTLRLSDRRKNQECRELLAKMHEAGWHIVLTAHHLMELVAHRDDNLVRRRIDAIRSLPAVAWLRGLTATHTGFGSILDIRGYEIRLACSNDAIKGSEVVSRVRDALIGVGSGREAYSPYECSEAAFREHVMRREQRAMAVAGISESSLQNVDGTLRQVLAGSLADAGIVDVNLANLEAILRADLKHRGDRRMADPAEVARDFVREIDRQRPSNELGLKRFIGQLLASCDIDMDELTLDSKLSELGELAVFRKQLRILQAQTQIPWEQIKMVRADQMPSVLVERAMRRYRDRGRRADAGNLHDAHLAAMAPYFDLMIVDKRTNETVRRVRQSEPGLRNYLESVHKGVGTFPELARVIAART